MNNQTKMGNRWFAWCGLAIIGLAIPISFMMLRPLAPKRVTITTDANGNAQVVGVPLLNTNIRDGAFKAMGSLGMKVALTVPTPPTNAAQTSNLVGTLQSMSRAGLFSTNPPANPYE